MTTTISAPSPGFERAAANTVAVLGSAMTQLRRWSISARGFDDEHTLMYLYSLALLASQRGRHLIDEIPDELDPVGEDGPGDLLASLVTAYDELVDHTSGLDSFITLKFVTEVGALCRGVERYVGRH